MRRRGVAVDQHRLFSRPSVFPQEAHQIAKSGRSEDKDSPYLRVSTLKALIFGRGVQKTFTIAYSVHRVLRLYREHVVSNAASARLLQILVAN